MFGMTLMRGIVVFCSPVVCPYVYNTVVMRLPSPPSYSVHVIVLLSSFAYLAFMFLTS